MTTEQMNTIYNSIKKDKGTVTYSCRIFNCNNKHYNWNRLCDAHCKELS